MAKLAHRQQFLDLASIVVVVAAAAVVVVVVVVVHRVVTDKFIDKFLPKSCSDRLNDFYI